MFAWFVALLDVVCVTGENDIRSLPALSVAQHQHHPGQYESVNHYGSTVVTSQPAAADDHSYSVHTPQPALSGSEGHAPQPTMSDTEVHVPQPDSEVHVLQPALSDTEVHMPQPALSDSEIQDQITDRVLHVRVEHIDFLNCNELAEMLIGSDNEIPGTAAFDMLPASEDAISKQQCSAQVNVSLGTDAEDSDSSSYEHDDGDEEYVPDRQDDDSCGSDSDEGNDKAPPVRSSQAKHQPVVSTVLPQGKYRRPQRPCKFCGQMQTHLSRHIMTVHRNESEVAAIKCFPQTEKAVALSKIKKEGILQENRLRIKGKNVDLPILHEKRQKNFGACLKMCTKCKGFYRSNLLWKHLLKCTGDESVCDTDGLQLSDATILATSNSEFNNNVLLHFRSDDIGILCKMDRMITTVGKVLWERSVRKERKSTMGEMRKLASLLHAVRNISKNDKFTGHDMLLPANFRTVVEALNTVTAKEEDGLKAGLKLSLGYLLKKAARFTKCEFIIDGKDEEVRETDKFLSLLDGSWGYLFNSAQIQLEANQALSLRRPRSLPLEEDVQKLRTYVLSRIKEMVGDEFLVWTPSEFIELRSLLVSRLTLFNSRRGGEPARLLLTEWSDAEGSAWISDQMTQRVEDPLEKALLGKYHLAYQRGKGSRRMVPILIPVDMLTALKLLVKVRPECAVDSANPYLFATTKSSDGHADGWQSVKATCVRAGVSQPDKLTATKMRHRASTFYALLDLPENERRAFYNHMGHSRAVNEEVYQCPPSLIEITKVGRYLEDLDSGRTVSTSSAGSVLF